MRALVVLCAAGASALQYEAAALRRALGAAKPLRNGAVVFRREFRNGFAALRARRSAAASYEFSAPAPATHSTTSALIRI